MSMSPAPVWIRVQGLVALEPWIVSTLPAVPVAVKSATRWVVVAEVQGRRTCGAVGIGDVG
jgi:hypothetical protein